MNRKHDTPEPVAIALARHIPRNVHRLLEPCVGAGSLIKAAANKLSKAQVTAIDLCGDALDLCKREVASFGLDLRFLNECFLKWAEEKGPKVFPFDCVLMNPPFSAKRKQWIATKWISEHPGFSSVPARMPIEAAFILAALILLKDGGRLVAVLPPTVISSDSLGWLRSTLIDSGDLRIVHELGSFTFPSIESKMYLVVYDKRRRSNTTWLMNHDLDSPEKLAIKRHQIGSANRLDFAFRSAADRLIKVEDRFNLNWAPLADLCQIHRGTVKTPTEQTSMLHTTSFVNGFWIRPNARGSAKCETDLSLVAHPRDILVSRVGRFCSQRFGLYVDEKPCLCSDCILILHPRSCITPAELLFAIRVISHPSLGSPVLERGTGASYITESGLRKLRIPTGLAQCYVSVFRTYKGALKKRDLNKMLEIEGAVRNALIIPS